MQPSTADSRPARPDPRNAGARGDRTRSADDLGVSTITGYIMTFFIASILLGIAIISNQNLVSSYGDVVSRNALETIGNNLALRIENADRVARASVASAATMSALNVTIPIPLQVAGRPYTLAIGPTGVTLQSVGSQTAWVTIPLNNSTPMATRTLSSSRGQVLIAYNTSTGQLDFQ